MIRGQVDNPWLVWAASSRFLFPEWKLPERPVSIQKFSRSKVRKTRAARKGDWRHTVSAIQMHCLQMT